MAQAESGETVVVGRIGRAHGIRGELAVEPRTDEPERRFADGAVLGVLPGPASLPNPPARLTVAGTRMHSGRLLVRFDGVADRTQAEALRGLLLTVPLDPLDRPEDPEEFYDHQLIGLSVHTVAGRQVGTIAEVVHGPAQDLLVVRREQGGPDVLVPFVVELVPQVDLEERRILVVDQPGLLEPASAEEA